MERKFGVDISKWQGSVDMEALKAEGVEFVIIRAGYSSANSECHVDEYFEENYKKAREAGLQVGVYWYTKNTSPIRIRREAEWVIENILAGKCFDTPIYLDIEDKVHLESTPSLNTDVVRMWASVMGKSGYLPGVYSFLSFFRANLNDKSLLDIAHWVAHYSAECGYTPGARLDMWQFGGNVNKINSPVIAGKVMDQNYMYTDYLPEIKTEGLNGYSVAAPMEPLDVVYDNLSAIKMLVDNIDRALKGGGI